MDKELIKGWSTGFDEAWSAGSLAVKLGTVAKSGDTVGTAQGIKAGIAKENLELTCMTQLYRIITFLICKMLGKS